MTEEMTQEEIDRQYKAAMDSVNFLNSPRPDGMNPELWERLVDTNVAHLKLTVDRPYMQGKDLTPLHAAIAANP